MIAMLCVYIGALQEEVVMLFVRNNFKHLWSGNSDEIAKNKPKQRLGPIDPWSPYNSFSTNIRQSRAKIGSKLKKY